MTQPVIEYFSAIDTKARMKKSVKVTGIPHVLIIDPKGVVRWEGFPLLEGFELTEKVVADILAKPANDGEVAVFGLDSRTRNPLSARHLSRRISEPRCCRQRRLRRGPNRRNLRYRAPVRQVIIPDRGEHFNGHRIFEDFCPMFHSSGDTPAIANLDFECLGADQKPNAALDQLAGLLVRMGMVRQDRAFAETKLGHQRPLAVNQRLQLNTFRAGRYPLSLCFWNMADGLSGEG